MQIRPSVILSFITGRLYVCSFVNDKPYAVPPTEAFADLIEALIGKSFQTIDLLVLKPMYSEQLLNQLPEELQDIIINWQHSDMWPELINSIDEKFGMIEITKV